MASPPGPLRALRTPRGWQLTASVAAIVALVLVSAWIIPARASQPTEQPASPATESSAAGARSATSARPAMPKPASATRKARNVPDYPRDRRHHGKRIVYDKALMTVWLINEADEVVARYPVVGRFDRPVKGTYRIYSKSKHSSNPFSKVTFDHMVRFAWGPDTKSSIGFHSIPRYYDGSRMHSPRQLGLAIARGGCVRLSETAAAKVYRFLDVGDLVVVLPSP